VPKPLVVDDRTLVNVGYSINALVDSLNKKNEDETDTGETYASGPRKGQPKMERGPLYGKLSRFLISLKTKIGDRRYAFMYQAPADYDTYRTDHQGSRVALQSCQELARRASFAGRFGPRFCLEGLVHRTKLGSRADVRSGRTPAYVCESASGRTHKLPLGPRWLDGPDIGSITVN
jgi:hypothetical protein